MVIWNDPRLDLVTVSDGEAGAVLGRAAASELGLFDYLGLDPMVTAPGLCGEMLCGLKRIGPAEELGACSVFDS